MNRKQFLKTVGLVGVGAVLPMPKIPAAFADNAKNALTDCWLTPASTEGPYYFDAKQMRQSIVTDSKTGVAKTGVPLRLTINVLNANCDPISNVLVDIWHCDKDGVYSGYPGQLGGLNTTGQDFLRGTQMTDANGQVVFDTIYPGWYPGRTTHIHFKARLTSMTYVTSQFAFNEQHSSEVYITDLYKDHGQKDTSNASDGVFHNAAPQYLMLTTSFNETEQRWEGTYTIGINAQPNSAKEDTALTGGEFTLEQNFPNPVTDKTTIRFTLLRNSNVQLSIYDLNGKQVVSLIEASLLAGEHSHEWMLVKHNKLASGNYVFQLTVENSTGLYRQAKVMTIL
jgi:protocatechuate 3,4-dioxygenase beta subunit